MNDSLGKRVWICAQCARAAWDIALWGHHAASSHRVIAPRHHAAPSRGGTPAEFSIPETSGLVHEMLGGSQCDAMFLPFDPTPDDRSMIVLGRRQRSIAPESPVPPPRMPYGLRLLSFSSSSSPSVNMSGAGGEYVSGFGPHASRTWPARLPEVRTGVDGYGTLHRAKAAQDGVIGHNRTDGRAGSRYGRCAAPADRVTCWLPSAGGVRVRKRSI
jgi:hypothetical protein